MNMINYELEQQEDQRRINLKHKFTAVLIASVILLVSLLVATVAITPYHAEYVALGGIVPVEQLGIDGSVYFTYVREGYVSNIYELYRVYLRMSQPTFTRLEEPYNNSLSEEEFELLYYYKEETLDNALYYASQYVDEAMYDDPSVELKYQELLGELEEYLGDSFGLMVAIGLVEEVTNRDFSYGGFFTIAGTGTIEWDNSVGSVGAIEQKLLTAERLGVDIFFVPRDDYYFKSMGYESISNQREAEQVVEQFDLSLEVVPVSTLDEAIFYLENLVHRVNYIRYKANEGD